MKKNVGILAVLFGLIYLPFYVVFLLTKQKKYW